MIRLPQEEFEDLVEQALGALPSQFQPYLENVVVEVRARPGRRILADLGLEDGRDLLGSYHGVPLTAKSVSAPFDWPEHIYIFQRNVERICHTRQDVLRQIRTTVLHEIGHHLGMDENELEDLGYG